MNIIQNEYEGFKTESRINKAVRLMHTALLVLSIASLTQDSRPMSIASGVIGIIDSVIALYMHRQLRLSTDPEEYLKNARRSFCMLFTLGFVGVNLLMIQVINNQIGWPVGFLTFLNFAFSLSYQIINVIWINIKGCCCKDSLIKNADQSSKDIDDQL